MNQSEFTLKKLQISVNASNPCELLPINRITLNQCKLVDLILSNSFTLWEDKFHNKSKDEDDEK